MTQYQEYILGQLTGPVIKLPSETTDVTVFVAPQYVQQAMEGALRRQCEAIGVLRRKNTLLFNTGILMASTAFLVGMILGLWAAH